MKQDYTIDDRMISRILARQSVDGPRVNRARLEAAAMARSVAAINEPVKVTIDVDIAFVRALIASNLRRSEFFSAGLFGDPAWHILLDLTAARLAATTISVSSLCIAAQVPIATALRHIKSMIENGYLERRDDPLDRRRSFVTTSDATHSAMLTCLTRMRADLKDF